MKRMFLNPAIIETDYNQYFENEGRRTGVWSDSGHTESCFVVEFCLGKEKVKPLGVGEEPGDQWGGKITYFGLKMNDL